VRLVANVRIHPKTGIYWYRRAVPARLRRYLPEVDGFPTKEGRTEFTKTLGTRIKAEANREAARLDQQIEAAFAAAEARLSALDAVQPRGAPAPAGGPPPPIDPRTAFAALTRWEAKAIRAAETRLFNAPLADRRTDEDARRGDLVMALRARPMRFTKAWSRIAQFNERLAEALCSEGVAATADHPALERLRDEFAARWESVLIAEDRMRKGEWQWSAEAGSPSTTTAASSVQHASAAAQPGMTVRALLDEYLHELRNAAVPEKTIKSNERVFARFVEFVGEVTEARSVDAATVRNFRDRAMDLPARPALTDRDLSMSALQRKYAHLPPEARLHRKTVSKWLDFVHAAFEHGCQQDHLPANPVAKAKFRRTRGAQAPSRTSFTTEDLQAIFGSPLFRGCAGRGREHKPGPKILWGARYWVMLLAAQSGARINELGQLHVTDVKHDEATGIAYLHITPDAEVPDAAAKRLKTASSERMVPLHPRLIELGVLDYVAARRQEGTPHLFPDLDHGRTFEPTKNLSRWFGRYFGRIGITDERKVFHSFRHWIKTVLRKASINRDVSDYLTGHAPNDVSGRYGGAPPIRELAAVVEGLPLEFLSGLARVAKPEVTPPVKPRASAPSHRRGRFLGDGRRSS